MTHTVHPYVQRLGLLRDWKSRWFGVGEKYRKFLKSDVLIREYLEKKMRTMHVSSIEMERSPKELRIIIRTSRPGLVIGRSGEGAQQIKNEVLDLMRKRNLEAAPEIKIDVEEIKSAESDASIVGQMVRDSLEKRMPYRRVLKQTIDKVMANRNVQGVRIIVAGRLGGAEMSRRQEVKKGRIPLQTLRADIDFAQEEALLPYGVIGIKVWIYRGEVFEK
jgi:small subunit ribosomal protein S3